MQIPSYYEGVRKKLSKEQQSQYMSCEALETILVKVMAGEDNVSGENTDQAAALSAKIILLRDSIEGGLGYLPETTSTIKSLATEVYDFLKQSVKVQDDSIRRAKEAVEREMPNDWELLDFI